MPTLSDPLTIGALKAPNRILMAPMTRGRSTKEGVPTAIMPEYYAQRASAGLIVSEGTGISREGLGWAYAPGIWNDEQIEAWKPVTKAVHDKGGHIFCQLWHEGRLVQPAYTGGQQPVSASATKAEGKVPTYEGEKPYVEARPLRVDEMPRVCAEFAKAARNALAAGFDGVEIHAANGYLIDEFLRDSTNKRDDDYGGSIENRIRLLVEVTRAVVAAVGADRTGVRLSPNDEIFGVVDSDPGPLFEAAAKALSALKVAYVHVREPGNEGTFGKAKYPPISPRIKAAFDGPFILNADFDGPKGQAALDAGEADAIAYGRPFISNPDLPRRIAEGKPLKKDDKSTWYTQGTKGYSDYPSLDAGDAGNAATPLLYAPAIEQVKPDEAEAIAGIIQAMTKQSEIVAGRERHAVRASHAKSTGVVTGELTVLPDLPPELAQGLFAKPGTTYKIAVRFAQGPGEIASDKISTHRGMAIKVFGVEGEKLPGHADDTQDFVLATGTVFPSGTAQQFLKDEKQILLATKAPESVGTALKGAVSSIAQTVTKMVGGKASPKADFFGHPPTHPLSDAYYSQAPIRYGELVAKVAAFPTAPDMKAMADEEIDVGADHDGFRHAVVGFFRGHDVHFDLRVQLWTNADTQPIEDTSVEWKETETPYVTVATIKLPRQEAYSSERQRYFDDVMSFRPAHTLAAHRPLGSVMRARLKVYQALSDYRHTTNDAPREEPASPERIPA